MGDGTGHPRGAGVSGQYELNISPGREQCVPTGSAIVIQYLYLAGGYKYGADTAPRQLLTTHLPHWGGEETGDSLFVQAGGPKHLRGRQHYLIKHSKPPQFAATTTAPSTSTTTPTTLQLPSLLCQVYKVKIIVLTHFSKIFRICKN